VPPLLFFRPGAGKEELFLLIVLCSQRRGKPRGLSWTSKDWNGGLMKLFLVVIAAACFASAQEIPADNLPANDLVAWSGMQTPEAMPPAAAQANAPALHTVTGSISKDGDTYVLKVSDTTSYKLDDQAKAKQYNGQKVRVTGEVDLNTDQIHVRKIEPLV